MSTWIEHSLDRCAQQQTQDAEVLSSHMSQEYCERDHKNNGVAVADGNALRAVYSVIDMHMQCNATQCNAMQCKQRHCLPNIDVECLKKMGAGGGSTARRVAWSCAVGGLQGRMPLAAHSEAYLPACP